MGSTWEHMIRTIKSCLYKTIGHSRMNYLDLTVISDIQNGINSRPLIYKCSSDSNLEIITLYCFLLLPNANVRLLLLKMDDQDVWKADPPSGSGVIKPIEACDALLSMFHELLYHDYV